MSVNANETPPVEDSTLMRVSRGLGVAFWALALANGLYLVISMNSQWFWSSVHQLCCGLLLVMVAVACGAWEVKSLRAPYEPTGFFKMGREIFLACMYFAYRLEQEREREFSGRDCEA
ncbi:unnamed protein product [Effrenium voratum]|nr:unnamed protein product [Effrenium voratum]